MKRVRIRAGVPVLPMRVASAWTMLAIGVAFFVAALETDPHPVHAAVVVPVMAAVIMLLMWFAERRKHQEARSDVLVVPRPGDHDGVVRRARVLGIVQGLTLGAAEGLGYAVFHSVDSDDALLRCGAWVLIGFGGALILSARDLARWQKDTNRVLFSAPPVPDPAAA